MTYQICSFAIVYLIVNIYQICSIAKVYPIVEIYQICSIAIVYPIVELYQICAECLKKRSEWLWLFISSNMKATKMVLLLERGDIQF